MQPSTIAAGSSTLAIGPSKIAVRTKIAVQIGACVALLVVLVVAFRHQSGALKESGALKGNPSFHWVGEQGQSKMDLIDGTGYVCATLEPWWDGKWQISGRGFAESSENKGELITRAEKECH